MSHAVLLRKLLVHLYDEIDYSILHASIQPALEDFAQFVALFEGYLDGHHA